MLVNIISTGIVVAILGGAIYYIYKAKKSGKKCIGCPDSGSCGAGKCGSCNCGCHGDKTE